VKTLEPCLLDSTQEEKVPDPNYNHNFVRYIPSDTDPVSPELSDQSDEEDVHSECGTSQENEKEKEEEVTCAINALP